jgi:phosphoribosylanthranilate isomerase
VGISVVMLSSPGTLADVWIKICGLSEPASVEAAVASGADAVGFVFAPGSPRFVEAATARALVETVPPGVETVGVFRDQPLAEVLRVAREAGVATIQVHGHEDPEFVEAVRQAGFAVIRAISAARFAEEDDGHAARFGGVRLLLDAPDPGAGATFEASALGSRRPAPGWVLAGGLTPANVARLVETLAPSGVDVSSGVESSRGVKSVGLIRDFVAAIRGAAA